ncbi:hypothetical protein BJV74DRAFT_882794 [Russula compacta]|nr:hypothetical protein BJV74DRAFT_882794 [Russula compacta]
MLKDLEVQLEEQLTESPPLPQSDLVPPLSTYAPDSGSGQSDGADTIYASPALYRGALISTLAELSEDDEFESFVACIPSFFDSHVVSDISTMLDLTNPSGGGDSTFSLRLHHLFKTSLPKAPSLGPDDRKRHLHVCLAAIWSYAKAYSMSNPRERPIPEHFRTLFADLSGIDSLLTDEDMVSRVMVLCISSLLAIKIMEDVRYRNGKSTDI